MSPKASHCCISAAATRSLAEGQAEAGGTRGGMFVSRLFDPQPMFASARFVARFRHRGPAAGQIRDGLLDRHGLPAVARRGHGQL
jgi:hypothetical protein